MFFKYFKVQTKRGTLENFRPYKLQESFYKNILSEHNRVVILKARQLGFSTLLSLVMLDRIMSEKNYHALQMADTNDHARDLFAKIKIAWKYLPENLKLLYEEKYNSKNELYLDAMDSKIKVSTSGRSGTLQFAHASEFAFFSEKMVMEFTTGTLNAIVPNGQVVVETTANGMNHFKDFWDASIRGETGFTTAFYPWYQDPQYVAKYPKKDSWMALFNELAGKYEIDKGIQRRYKLSDSQLYWYFLKMKEQGEKIKQEYPCSPEEAFLTSGRNVFKLSLISQIIPQSYERKEGVKFYEKPITSHKYLIGADVGEGTGGDSSAFVVLDRVTCDIVATYKNNKIEPTDFAVKLVEIAKFYGGARLVIERNNSGISTVLKIRELGYANQYINRSIDKITKKPKNELGWRTTNANRDLMIDQFRDAVHNGEIGIPCKDILDEMYTFVVKDNKKREHSDNSHDDLLFASFLAWQGKKQILEW